MIIAKNEHANKENHKQRDDKLFTNTISYIIHVIQVIKFYKLFIKHICFTRKCYERLNYLDTCIDIESWKVLTLVVNTFHPQG